MLFGTTKEFLVHFGLRGLDDLPKPRELDELLAEGERKAQALETAPPEVPDAAAVPPAPDESA
jgi:hypothetical protein